MTVVSALCVMTIPRAAKAARSASVYLVARTVVSNSPWTMLWARYPTTANSLDSPEFTVGL